MEKIRKNGLEKVINRHKAECSKIQPIVNTMLETGFCFTTDELKDLASVCSKLYKQTENMAKEEAARSKVKFRSNADYTETLEYLNDAVSRNADALRKALLYHTQNPLEIKAYEVTDGVVQVSSRWIEEKDAEYTILPTENREQAKLLVDNVRQAIDELNALVSHNRFFGKGISTSLDSRRCLCWLDGDGNFHEEKENYEFI